MGVDDGRAHGSSLVLFRHSVVSPARRCAIGRILRRLAMSRYKITEIGKLQNVLAQSEGKAFLHDSLGLTSCEISINAVPGGWKAPFCHRHKQNEEIYIFLKGSGKMMVDGESFDVSEGSCVRVAPQGNRSLENTGDGELQFICVQAKENSLDQYALSDGEIG